MCWRLLIREKQHEVCSRTSCSDCHEQHHLLCPQLELGSVLMRAVINRELFVLSGAELIVLTSLMSFCVCLVTTGLPQRGVSVSACRERGMFGREGP